MFVKIDETWLYLLKVFCAYFYYFVLEANETSIENFVTGRKKFFFYLTFNYLGGQVINKILILFMLQFAHLFFTNYLT